MMEAIIRPVVMMNLPEPCFEQMPSSIRRVSCSLKLDLQESDIKISQLEKKANKSLSIAKLDGTVTYVRFRSVETTDESLIKVKSSDGFYVINSVSELMLDDIKEGTNLTAQVSQVDLLKQKLWMFQSIL